VFEDRHVELRSLFGLTVVPEKRGYSMALHEHEWLL
jgi:hypothetical protein